MATSIVTVGPASAAVGPCGAVPEHLQEKVREVTGVFVDPLARRQGHGSALMRKICADADISGLVLLLAVDPEEMTIDQLEAWYARFGFVVIQLAPALLMAREPSPSILLIH